MTGGTLGRGLMVSHDASRTGAPTMLSRLVRWLVAQGYPAPTIVVRAPGPLEAEFTSVAPFIKGYPSESDHRFPRRMRRAGWVERVKAELAATPFDFVYSSTMTNGGFLRDVVGPLSVPLITRVSELDFWLSNYVDAVSLRHTLDQTDHFVCVAGAVQQLLHSKYGVDDAKSTIIPGFVEAVPSSAERLSNRERARTAWGIGVTELVVGGVGTLDWRKGADLFVQLASRCSRGSGDVRFVWMGGGPDDAVARLRHDVERSRAPVTFLGQQPDAAAMVAGFDLLCLTSREDPYPVAMLECGAAGVPVVCFEGSGGATDFVGAGAGLQVPYLDVGAMADAILRLSRDAGLRSDLGDAARELVRSAHTVDSVAPRILEVIRDAGRT
jgi:glycosyltransferase involved in cell wall biosynthesis